jgi:hypothetical protein
MFFSTILHAHVTDEAASGNRMTVRPTGSVDEMRQEGEPPMPRARSRRRQRCMAHVQLGMGSPARTARPDPARKSRARLACRAGFGPEFGALRSGRAGLGLEGKKFEPNSGRACPGRAFC